MGLTEPLVRALTPAQIQAIAAHELGHLSESKATRRKRWLLGWIVPIMFILLTLAQTHVLPFWLVFSALGAFILVGGRPIRRFTRGLEAEADAFAHRLNEDGAVLASALERLYELNLSPVVTGKKHTTHPDLYDRLLALGVTPAFAKPEPPSKRALRGAFRLAFVVALLGFGLPAYWLSQPHGWGSWTSGLSRVLTGTCVADRIPFEGRSIASVIVDRCGFTAAADEEDD
jgi:hypothetical protein